MDLVPLARRVAAAYVRNPETAALLVAGSVGSGTADAYSDLDMVVFWRTPPSDEARRAPILALGSQIGEIHPFEEDEWAEAFELDGTRIGTSMFLAATMDRYIDDVVDRASPDDNPQILIAAVQQGVPLHGHELIAAWRSRSARYPDALMAAVYERHFSWVGGWGSAAMLAARDDLVALYSIVDDAARAMLRMLLALSRRYLADARMKWLDRLGDQLEVSPVNLAARLRRVYVASPDEGVAELQSLLEESLVLVETHRPDLDTRDAREWITAHR